MSASKLRHHQRYKLTGTSSITLLTGMLSALSAYAQTAAPATETSVSNDLEEIVVTAQKRSESLLSTAAPVTALQSGDLERGTARSDGFEFAWLWKPISGLKLSANGAYTDAKLTADAPLIGGKSGDRLPDVPRFFGNLSADYDFPLTSGLGGFLGGNLQYVGERLVDFVPEPATVPRTCHLLRNSRGRGGVSYRQLSPQGNASRMRSTR